MKATRRQHPAAVVRANGITERLSAIVARIDRAEALIYDESKPAERRLAAFDARYRALASLVRTVRAFVTPNPHR